MSLRSSYRLVCVALLAAGVAALARWHGGQQIWFMTWLLTGLLMISLAGWLLSLLRLRLTRTTADTAIASGDKLEVSLEIRQLSFLPLLWLSVSDHFIRQQDNQLLTVTKLVFPGIRRRFRVSYRISGLERGEYRFVRTELVTGDMWGLAVKSKSIPSNGHFTVLPEARWSSSVDTSCNGNGAEHLLRLSPFCSDSVGYAVQDYVSGDPLHRIHWKSTARQGELMTRITEPTEESSYLICLDGTSVNYQEPRGRLLFEQGVEWCAGLLQAAANNHCMAGILCNNMKRLWIKPDSRPDYSLIQRHLAVLTADGRTPFVQLIDQVESLAPDLCTIIVITPEPALAVTNRLSQLRETGRQVLVCCLSDQLPVKPQLLHWHKQLRLAGCQVILPVEARRERQVRVDAQYEGA